MRSGGGEKVSQLSAEERAKKAKDSGHALLTYLAHFNHLPHTDTSALQKLKTSLINIEGGLMTKAAMLREEQGNNKDNIYDFRCDVVAQARQGVQFYLDGGKK